MEAGLWTGQGYSAPWMFHSMAGQYTLLEKQLDPDFSPGRRRPPSRVLQDSTNWLDAQPLPARWGLLKREGQGRWFPGKEPSGEAPSPKAPRPQRQRQPSPTYRGFPGWRDRSWRAKDNSSAASRQWWPGGAPAQGKSDLPARAPPSYEAHMLLRLRVGQGPRKENWPQPPPYVAPPSYEAPHLTVRPPTQQQRVPPQRHACKEASPAGRHFPRDAPGKAQPRAAGEVRVPWTPGPAGKAGRAPAGIPGSWSYLSGTSTWSGPKVPLGRADQEESSYGSLARWDMSPQHRSHTLPRRRKPTKGVPLPHAPEHTLPAGWGFSHTAARPPAVAGKAGRVGGGRPRRDLFPPWKEPGPGKEPGESQGALWKSTPRRRGGLFVIDATCVVIQAHYIPPPRMERVRYLGLDEGPEKAKAAPTPHGSPGPVSMEERAARILGLSLSELGLSEAGAVPGTPRAKVGESYATSSPDSEEVSGTGPPGGHPPALASPRKPFLPAPALSSFQAGPAEQAVPSLDEGGPPAAPCHGNGCLPLRGDGEPGPPADRASYALDLKEAMSRIRRHTAPDSEDDDDDGEDEEEEEEELDKERQPLGKQQAWNGQLEEGALSYSSSSLDSSSSNATVVPRNATPTLRNGPAREGRSVQVVPEL